MILFLKDNSSYSQPSEDEHDESVLKLKFKLKNQIDLVGFRYSSSTSSLVMLVVHNLDHMMQPHEWETLLTREIHGARVSRIIFFS